MSEAYDGREVVGMDLHRRRSVLVRMTADGRKLETARITNSPAELRRQIARAGVSPRVVVEATYGWYWAADTLAAAGAEVHLAHPLGVKGFAYRRVKNDERDAADLADLLRMGAAAGGVDRPGPGARAAGADPLPAQAGQGPHQLQGPGACGAGQAGHPGHLHRHLRRVGQHLAGRAGACRSRMRGRWPRCARSARCWPPRSPSWTPLSPALLEHDRGYQAIRALPGIGPVLGAVIVAEIGDITRFPAPARLCSWAGLTPRHRESDTKVSRGHITKQGSRMLRWALIEAIQHVPAGHPLRQRKEDIIARRGAQARNIAKVAAARQLLTWVYYAMRDGQVRCPGHRHPARPGEQARPRAARDRRFYWPPPAGGRPPV